MPSLDPGLVERLHRQARAERWQCSKSQFAAALAASVGRAFAEDQAPSARDVERYLASLHLEDLALACACAAGDDAAWEHFIRAHRPVLYRAADALEPGGGARDLADSLYADLFGLATQGGERRSLFRYFHGRSSLGTWLRAVLSQRFVDRVRTRQREDALPDDDSPATIAAPSRPVDPHRERDLTLMQRALTAVMAALDPHDRLRLACYYAQQLTLAQTGRILGEHEATVSRQLARSRREIRAAVERRLQADGLSNEEIARCFESVSEDAGPLDVSELLSVGGARKKSPLDRSNEESAT
ncbi:MAG TPA: sigma-70 family RNA polymerase sigma factor [Vicinamibacterales bacterium]|nr:sigma-70 family RNA polymerase sigma factor [Vicinamibacterales bacterium]